MKHKGVELKEIPTREGYQGAVRIADKTVEEIAAEREERTITV